MAHRTIQAPHPERKLPPTKLSQRLRQASKLHSSQIGTADYFAPTSLFKTKERPNRASIKMLDQPALNRDRLEAEKLIILKC